MNETHSEPARRGRPPRSAAEIVASRRRIVAAARDLFAAEGYAGVSMRKIAARAGCLPSTLYALFPNKRGLLHILWESIFSDLIDLLDRIYAESPASSRLSNLCLAQIDFWLQRPEDYRAIFLVEDRIQDSDDPYFVENPMAKEALAILQRAVSEAQALGEIGAANEKDILNVLLCCIQGVVYNLVALPEFGWADPELIKTMTVRAVLQGLR